MPRFYLDIETEGLNYSVDKILTVQCQELDEYTGRPLGRLEIFKEWESSEREMLQRFLEYSELVPGFVAGSNPPEENLGESSPFTMVPVGYNLPFDFPFLMARMRFYGIPFVNLWKRPHLDLHTIGVLMNHGQFKGSGLDKITGKPHNGTVIPEWYYAKRYDDIEQYIRKEAVEFLKLLYHCQQELPQVLKRFKTEGVDISAMQV